MTSVLPPPSIHNQCVSDEAIQKTRQGEHRSYIDILRLFAIILVVFNHTPAYHFPLNNITSWGVGMCMMLISVMTKVAVPLFFMISGGLLLSRQESIRQVLLKRVGRVGLLIAFFWAVHFACGVWCHKIDGHVATYFSALWSPNKAWICVEGVPEIQSLYIYTEAYAGWFLYAYMGLMFMLPMLRAMVQNMKNEYFVYMILLLVSVGIILPAGFYLIFGYEPSLYLKNYISLINHALLPFILGYFVEHRMDVRGISWWKIACGCGIFLLMTLFVAALSCHVKLHSTMLPHPEIEKLSWFVSFSPLLAAMFYILCKKCCPCTIKSDYVRTVLMYLGNSVLTTMIFEVIFRCEFRLYFSRYYVSYLPSVYVSLLTVGACLMLGLVLKKVPFLKRIL